MKQVIATLVYFFMALPAFVFAQAAPVGRESTGSQPVGRENPAPGALPVGRENADAQSQGLSYSLQNPLAFDSIQGFIVAVLNIIIVIATPIVVIFIILAGFKYVTARGDASKVQEATRALTYSVIGGVLIIGAVAIAEIIKNLIVAFGA